MKVYLDTPLSWKVRIFSLVKNLMPNEIIFKPPTNPTTPKTIMITADLTGLFKFHLTKVVHIQFRQLTAPGPIALVLISSCECFRSRPATVPTVYQLFTAQHEVLATAGLQLRCLVAVAAARVVLHARL